MSVALFNEPASHLDLATALLARLNSADGLAGMSTPLTAFSRDDVPQSGGDYVILDLTRTVGGNRRLGGGIAPSSWYATVTAVGGRTATASAILRRATIALTGFQVTVDDVTSTGLDFDGALESVIEQDEYDTSLWSGSRTFTFAF